MGVGEIWVGCDQDTFHTCMDFSKNQWNNQKSVTTGIEALWFIMEPSSQHTFLGSIIYLYAHNYIHTLVQIYIHWTGMDMCACMGKAEISQLQIKSSEGSLEETLPFVEGRVKNYEIIFWNTYERIPIILVQGWNLYVVQIQLGQPGYGMVVESFGEGG